MIFKMLPASYKRWFEVKSNLIYVGNKAKEKSCLTAQMIIYSLHAGLFCTLF